MNSGDRQDPAVAVQDPAATQNRGRRRLIRRLVLEITVVFTVFVVVLAAFQRRLIYAPRREAPSVERAAQSYSGRIVPVAVPVEAGLSLQGWLLPAEGALEHADPRGSVADDRPLVIWFTGNGGHRGHRLRDLAIVHRLGCHALIVDYRGYGENPGSPSEEAIAGDSRAIWRYAVEDLGKQPRQIVLMGESLGGGVAVRLASDLAMEGVTPGGLVLQSTFSSLVDAAGYHYPWLPVRLMLVDRYPSIERIGDVRCSILIVHGTLDQIVPFEQGRRLFEAAPARSEEGVEKRFLELPESDHNDILDMNPKPWTDALRAFLVDVHAQAAKSTRGASF